jgi:hypothetical protein
MPTWYSFVASDLPTAQRAVLGPIHVLIFLLLGSFPGSKAAGGKPNHLSESSVEVKNESNYSFTPTYVWTLRGLIKHEDSFIPCTVIWC